MKKKELSLYLHIPFCVQKCHYCDFFSAPAGEEEKEHYTEQLCRELSLWGDLLRENYAVRTVFIGGGTPTSLSPALLERIGRFISEAFDLQALAEYTVEANPGTVTREHGQALQEMGCTRISLGLQSAQEQELKCLGRIHSLQDFLDSYELLRELGFENINVDLMSAIPGQTPESYLDTLRLVTSLEPEHISAYSLIIEPGTPFSKWVSEGRLALPDEETDRSMYEQTGTFLAKQGYERYEISNYAKAGRECLHNLVYWSTGEYLGVGMHASSCLNGFRFTVPAKEKAYQQYLERLSGLRMEKLSEMALLSEVMDEWSVRTKKDQIEEFMFLGLRRMKGISKKEFEHRFGLELEAVYEKVLAQYIRQGLLQTSSDGDRILFTNRGIDVSNYVLADFLLS